MFGSIILALNIYVDTLYHNEEISLPLTLHPGLDMNDVLYVCIPLKHPVV